MNVLIVYAHPSRKSFTYRVLTKLLDGLKISGHQVMMSDLYEMNFQSDMSLSEYERSSSGDFSEDVVTEHSKIQHSDCIIFVYPVWWSDCPAKMKGWFDRVFCAGFAYGYDSTGNKTEGMKKQKLGLAICTAGHPEEVLHQTGITASMQKIMLDDRFGQRFERKEMIILSGTLVLEKVEASLLEKVFNMGKELDGLSINTKH